METNYLIFYNNSSAIQQEINQERSEKIILLINKTEAFAMRKLVGNENVKQTYSGHSKYYLVESYQNLKALDKYRKSKIVS